MAKFKVTARTKKIVSKADVQSNAARFAPSAGQKMKLSHNRELKNSANIATHTDTQLTASERTSPAQADNAPHSTDAVPNKMRRAAIARQATTKQGSTKQRAQGAQTRPSASSKTPQTLPQAATRGFKATSRTFKRGGALIKDVQQFSDTSQAASAEDYAASTSSAYAARGGKAVGHLGARGVKFTLKHRKQIVQAPRRAARAVNHSFQAARVAAKKPIEVPFYMVKHGAQALEKASIAAIRGMVAAAQSQAALLAGCVALVLVCALMLGSVAAIAASPFGIFFSKEEEGALTLVGLIAQVNEEYSDRMEEIKNISHDELVIDISRTPWPEVLAIYAITTSTDPDEPLEVVTLDEQKAEKLHELYWRMNTLDYRLDVRTTTTTNADGTTDTDTYTTLIITGTCRTAYDMAAALAFTPEQNQWLEELFDPAYAEQWQQVLYGSGSIVAVALSQVGNVGGEIYWSWYGFEYHVEWCAIFVSWCANECGYLDTGIMPRFAVCTNGIQWYKGQNRWKNSSHIPSTGDLIFFDWDGDGVANHVGIVNYVENGMVHTVEGNSGDACRERSYRLDSSAIMGYGVQG